MQASQKKLMDSTSTQQVAWPILQGGVESSNTDYRRSFQDAKSLNRFSRCYRGDAGFLVRATHSGCSAIGGCKDPNRGPSARPVWILDAKIRRGCRPRELGPFRFARPEAGPASYDALGKDECEGREASIRVNETFENTTDPIQKYCDTPGLTRLYLYPFQFTILQTPKIVYILYEFTRVWRSIAMDRDHPKDPDTTWLGDSIGRYGSDTLVIDTIGLNDKTWLDRVGHPHSDALHVIERFRRADHDTLELDVTFDDPKAYTKTWSSKEFFQLSSSPMGETLCSMSEMEAFQKRVIEPSTTRPPGK